MACFNLKINFSTKHSRYYWRHRARRIADEIQWCKDNPEERKAQGKRYLAKLRKDTGIAHGENERLRWIRQVLRASSSQVSQLQPMPASNRGRLKRSGVARAKKSNGKAKGK